MSKDKRRKLFSSSTEFAIAKTIGKAVQDFKLIDDGDRILVAVSGGKDSLTLLHLLQARQAYLPIKYDLLACHVSQASDCGASAHPVAPRLQALFEQMQVNYSLRTAPPPTTSPTRISKCYSCSKLRRMTLFQTAAEMGCNKVALGHHYDDAVETILMNLFLHSEVSPLKPKLSMFEGKFTLIRPLIYVEERQIIRYFKHSWQAIFSPVSCQAAVNGARQTIKNWLRLMERQFPQIKKNIFRAVMGQERAEPNL